uniref:SXP/RAL-2 family protein Ani s 5-like cation-binding domain-containing protein n=1 Tax=Parascaris equorum TaxID=6256 RepID=A0A914SF95_PAREQ
MRTIIIITALASAICAAPQSLDEQDGTLQKASFIHLGLMPKFLREASENARNEFWQILRNHSNTIAETHLKLQAWAAKQGDEVQKDFESAGEKLKEMIESLKEAISQSQLSEEAKDAFSHLSEIATDGSQTFGKQMLEIAKYMQSLPHETRQEMHNFVENAIKSVVHNGN